MPTLLLPLLLATFPSQANAPANLLANPSFELGGKNPKDWERGQPVPGVEYLLDESVAAEGKKSLALKKTVERYFPIAAWNQTIAHDGQARKLHFGALVKAAEARKALLDVSFEDAQGDWKHGWAAYIGAQETSAPAVSHDWSWYSGVVAVPEGTRKLSFGLQIYGPGTVWFDRALATFVEAETPTSDALAAEPRPMSAWGELPAGGKTAAGESDDVRVLGGDPLQRYVLHEPRGEAPADGFRLLVVLPGGDGSLDFRPFVGSIAAEALPANFLVAQAIAPAWSEDPERVVWPTRGLEGKRAKFESEAFIEAIIADVAKTQSLDARHVYLLGWSSGGPPCYAAAVAKDSRVRGALVAMSVFKPEQLGSLSGAKRRAFYVLHSPEDFIAMSFPERAVKDLEKAGARAKLVTYAGGHGWHGDVFGNIAAGVAWLEDNSAK
jgi:poly(3-hydroxybutyrate) depolymerase